MEAERGAAADAREALMPFILTFQCNGCPRRSTISLIPDEPVPKPPAGWVTLGAFLLCWECLKNLDDQRAATDLAKETPQ